MTVKQSINTILVVDDSATARMIVRQCLEIAGFQEREFLEAENGQKALHILRSNLVDFIVTDLNMPQMNGIELLKTIKSVPLLASIPVMIITSVSNPARDAELMVLGAAAVLAKPLTPAGLAHACSSFL